MKFNNCFTTFFFSVFFSVVIFSSSVSAQKAFTRQEINDSIQELPYFSNHLDNYFITGVPTNQSIDRASANAKYQISFKQILSKESLPYDTYLILTYTQKAFWNIYEDSFPFRDLNFHPTISLGKFVYKKNDELAGIATLSFEHESNGRDSIFSRSWNRLSLGYTTNIFKNTTASFKAWLPFAYEEGNPDLLDYVGLAEIKISHELIHDKLSFAVMARKGLNFKNGALRSRIYYNPFKRNIANQYIMLEWYLGQAESLLDYQQSQSMIRIGYVIKSNEFNWFRGKK
ncbi:phospholipase A [Mesonia ostreae]|uniref:Phosphatidylcholine 1-acylhydrolase n=1 Tax=Mesonia ostreae TaxID=861110 RepID=A0ABU2KHV6_9FLAO|nr:phospholipase A [Mesonia ostreae]MDT0294282.1 phospholipase A [Mesonia ostreae]